MTVITQRQHKQSLQNQRDRNRKRCVQCDEYKHIDHMPRNSEGLRFCSTDCLEEHRKEVVEQ